MNDAGNIKSLLERSRYEQLSPPEQKILIADLANALNWTCKALEKCTKDNMELSLTTLGPIKL